MKNDSRIISEQSNIPKPYLPWGVGLLALVTAIAFNFLLYTHQFGFAFSLFVLVLIINVHVLLVLTKRFGNAWAYLFLLPVIASLVAQVLYASPMTRLMSSFMTFVCLTLWAYWVSAPKLTFRDVQTLIPRTIFIESYFPFPRLSSWLKGLVRERSSTSLNIVLGIILAIPAVIVIGALFLSADQLFYKVFTDTFSFSNSEEFMARMFWNGFIFIFIAASGWTIVTRLVEKRTSMQEESEVTPPNRILITTFLSILNGLFLAFIGFQIVYFFGGESVILKQGITYATYAREGFFQLLAVSAIIVLILVMLYRYTKIRSIETRILSAMIIGQTGIVIVSALKRMSFYISAYGLTLDRYWALFAMSIIAVMLTFAFVAILLRIRYQDVFKFSIVSVMCLWSAMLLVNSEGTIANYNIDRYLYGKTDEIDIYYLQKHLSADVTPVLVNFALSEESTYKQRHYLAYAFEKQRFYLEKRDAESWKNLVLSERRAYQLLKGLDVNSLIHE
jgi:hypothetical protein